MKSIAVVGETYDSALTRHTAELIGGARSLADARGASVDLVLLSDGAKEEAGEGIVFGADRVFVLRHPLLGEYHADAWLMALEKLCKELEPGVVLMGQTATGRDLGPRLAVRLNTGIAMDCVSISPEHETGEVRLTRPVFGGKARAVLACRQKPAMATVRAKAMTALAPDYSRQGEVIGQEMEIEESMIRTRVVETGEERLEGVPLEDAEVVITGGRGIGGKEGFAMLEKMANLLNGAVGASRPPCDNEWVPPSRQVGLTGKIVSPRLYITVAVSGASQHMAGCRDANTIIAINKDSEAAIYNFAHYGVVEDFRKLMPSLLSELKERLE